MPNETKPTSTPPPNDSAPSSENEKPDIKAVLAKLRRNPLFRVHESDGQGWVLAGRPPLKENPPPKQGQPLKKKRRCKK